MKRSKRKRKKVDSPTRKYTEQESHEKTSKCAKTNKKDNSPASRSRSLSKKNGICVSVSAHQNQQVGNTRLHLKEVKKDPSISPNTISAPDVEQWSYNEITSCLRSYFHDQISISPQVHRRVSFLLCTVSAVRARSQRVRKAMKLGIPLLDVEWVFGKGGKDSKMKKIKSVDEWKLGTDGIIIPEDHIDGIAGGKEKKEEKAYLLSSVKVCKVKDSILGTETKMIDEDNQTKGWSEPKSLGCCCVCHENGTTASCPWCPNCI
mmetsp:Transcript_8746/g.19241  ORF Transcript_8746/g.19241 Transcript_8746/m.19241 type:complete len:262 (-) Transcript_8746:439-1224(-)